MNAPETITAIIDRASNELATSNARASKAQEDRDHKELRRLVEQYGLCNIASMLASICGDFEVQFEGDDDCADHDWRLAGKIMEMAAGGVDLNYGGGMPVMQLRQNAIEFVKQQAASLTV